MAITKKVGDNVGIQTLAITHAGPKRSVRLVMVLVLRKTMGHSDPALANPGQRFDKIVELPDAQTQTTTTFTKILMGQMPKFPFGSTLDVNLSIGKPLPPQALKYGGTWAAWYSNRDDDDWNDDVYKISTPASAEASLGKNPTYY